MNQLRFHIQIHLKIMSFIESTIQQIKRNPFWQFRDLYIVILLTTILMIIHWYLWNFSMTNWQLLNQPIEIDWDFSSKVQDIMKISAFLILFVSIFVNAFAITAPLSNTLLAFQVRILATSESFCKILFAICYLIDNICQLPNMIDVFHCHQSLTKTLKSLVNDYVWYGAFREIAQTTQLLISLGRFFAVSFDDFMTNRRMKILKKDGTMNVSRVESLLMIQASRY
ncbi:unnamed protein product, partial [Mesorhabditis belari]|uniref:Gustatory receptor n=1 Tax=Mesorhabditis belari TaxID=2138241 RepID=A0AAF3EP39_9BILA